MWRRKSAKRSSAGRPATPKQRRKTMEIDEIHGILTEFLATEANVLWIVDPLVHFDSDREEFQRSFDDCDADMLATTVRTRKEDPSWTWWSTLKEGNKPVPQDTGVAAL